MLKFKLPLNEIAVDFYDALKSLSSGYASFDYEEIEHQPSNIVKVPVSFFLQRNSGTFCIIDYSRQLNIMLNGEVVDELSTIVHASKAREYGRNICTRLKESIPKQLFQVAIQAAVGGKILARENIAALRKDVTAKCVSILSRQL